ncbi:MAG: SET domain-containing protein-lysine N-methyltransferase [Candidatus Thermoplasmatota archaeon]
MLDGSLMAKRRPLPEPQGWEYVKVSRSKLHGRGLFAAVDLPKGTYVMEYRGERIEKKESDKRTNKQWEKGRVYTFELSRRFDLDGSIKSNVARLANFSCDPNCESINEDSRKVWIVAVRDIKAGDEITYDYNFPLVEPPPLCHCGAAKCRGYIVGSDHVMDLDAWKELHPHLVKKDERKRSRR